MLNTKMDYFTTLPTELLLNIVSVLSFTERERLRSTCRFLHSFLTRLEVEYTTEFLRLFIDPELGEDISEKNILHPSQNGKVRGIIRGHSHAGKFIGSSRLLFYTDGHLRDPNRYYMEGHFGYIPDPEIHRFHPVGRWYSREKNYYFHLNFNRNGKKHSLEEKYFNNVLLKQKYYIHGTLERQLIYESNTTITINYENGIKRKITVEKENRRIEYFYRLPEINLTTLLVSVTASMDNEPVYIALMRNIPIAGVICGFDIMLPDSRLFTTLYKLDDGTIWYTTGPDDSRQIESSSEHFFEVTLFSLITRIEINSNEEEMILDDDLSVDSLQWGDEE